MAGSWFYFSPNDIFQFITFLLLVGVGISILVCLLAKSKQWKQLVVILISIYACMQSFFLPVHRAYARRPDESITLAVVICLYIMFGSIIIGIKHEGKLRRYNVILAIIFLSLIIWGTIISGGYALITP